MKLYEFLGPELPESMRAEYMAAAAKYVDADTLYQIAADSLREANSEFLPLHESATGYLANNGKVPSLWCMHCDGAIGPLGYSSIGELIARMPIASDVFTSEADARAYVLQMRRQNLQRDMDMLSKDLAKLDKELKGLSNER